MPVCKVKSNVVQEQTNQKTGGIMRSQMVALDLGNGYETAFRIGLGNNPPYAPGEYDIDPHSFGLSPYGNLQLNRYIDLIPLGAKPVKG